MNQPIIFIRYERWMNFCHYVGLGAMGGAFFTITETSASVVSVYGAMLALATLIVTITSAARSRFRMLAVRLLVEKGTDLSKQKIAFL